MTMKHKTLEPTEEIRALVRASCRGQYSNRNIHRIKWSTKILHLNLIAPAGFIKSYQIARHLLNTKVTRLFVVVKPSINLRLPSHSFFKSASMGWDKHKIQYTSINVCGGSSMENIKVLDIIPFFELNCVVSYALCLPNSSRSKSCR